MEYVRLNFLGDQNLEIRPLLHPVPVLSLYWHVIAIRCFDLATGITVSLTSLIRTIFYRIVKVLLRYHHLELDSHSVVVTGVRNNA